MSDENPAGGGAGHRSVEEVLNDHLRLRKEGLVEEDIARNYSEQVVFLTCTGIYRGHEGVRESVRILGEHFPGTDFHYRNSLADGEMAFLEWTGHSAKGDIKDGADSYLIRGGRIVAQTIHYTVE